MARYFLGRLVRAVPVILLASMGIFALLRAIPGDPALTLAGPDADPQTLDRIRRDLALDQSIVAQYLAWLEHLVRLDLGKSLISHQPVSELINYAWTSTVALVCAAVLVAALLGVGLGVVAGLRRGSWIDQLVSGLNALMMGIAPFWLGFLLILLFALTLGWLPSGGYVPFTEDPAAAVRSLVLPATCLGLTQAGVLARFVRASVIEVQEEQYVRTAISKGLERSEIVRRHILRNALIPIVTVFGIQLGNLLGGAVVIESMFSWPGIGRLLLDSVTGRDYPVVQTVLVLFLVAFVLLNLLTDVAYGLLDARLRK